MWQRDILFLVREPGHARVNYLNKILKFYNFLKINLSQISFLKVVFVKIIQQ